MFVTNGTTVQKLGIERRQLMFAGVSALAIATLPGGRAEACHRLVVGTWGGDFNKAIEAAIAKPFHRLNGGDYVPDLGAAGARKSRLLAERDRAVGSVDVICLDSFDMHQMAAQDLLLPIDRSTVPNLANVRPEFVRSHSVPMSFSGKVIVYNPTLMKRPRSYRDLWDSAYAGKVGLADLLALHVIEVAAVISGGGPTNYEPGKQKLLELKASGVKLYPSNEAVAAALASGEIWATIMWRARAHQWKNAGLPVEEVAAEEGVTPITFELAVPRNTGNKDCALDFLNQALTADSQAQLATMLGYAPTVSNVELPPELGARLDFSAAERANFFKQDFDYLLQNQPQLLDWWARVFKS